MTNKIEEIRNRHKRLEDMRSSTYPDEISDSWTYFGTWAAHHDRATLLAEVERFREALTDIANQETTGPYKWQLVVARLCEIAREALEGEP